MPWESNVPDALATIQRQQRRDITLLYRTLADAIRNVVPADGDRPVTQQDRAAIMREVDRSLDVIFGRYPGDPNAALRTVVIRDTNRARLQPLDAAVREIRRALPVEIVDAFERDAHV